MSTSNEQSEASTKRAVSESPLSDEMVEHYWEHGYTLVPGVFDAIAGGRVQNRVHQLLNIVNDAGHVASGDIALRDNFPFDLFAKDLVGTGAALNARQRAERHFRAGGGIHQ